MDYEQREIAGLTWEVVPTPGATNGASSYVVVLDGERLAFGGETICGPGRTDRLTPFQYDYNDLFGAANVWYAAVRLGATAPDLILPSLGEPIDDPASAIAVLRENIAHIDEINPGFRQQLIKPVEDDIEEVIPRLYRSRYTNAQTHFIVGKSGKILCIDYGYNTLGHAMPGKSYPSNRRSGLHGLSGLKKRTGATQSTPASYRTSTTTTSTASPYSSESSAPKSGPAANSPTC